MRVCTPRPPAACTSWASRRRRADRVRTGEPANRRSPEPRRGLAGGWRWGTLSAAEPDAGNPRGGGDLPPSWRTKLSEWQDARRLGHWEQSAVATWSNEMTPELLTSMRELDTARPTVCAFGCCGARATASVRGRQRPPHRRGVLDRGSGRPTGAPALQPSRCLRGLAKDAMIASRSTC